MKHFKIHLKINNKENSLIINIKKISDAKKTKRKLIDKGKIFWENGGVGMGMIAI